jgi:hypothetical protein
LFKYFLIFSHFIFAILTRQVFPHLFSQFFLFFVLFNSSKGRRIMSKHSTQNVKRKKKFLSCKHFSFEENFFEYFFVNFHKKTWERNVCRKKFHWEKITTFLFENFCQCCWNLCQSFIFPEFFFFFACAYFKAQKFQLFKKFVTACCMPSLAMRNVA